MTPDPMQAHPSGDTSRPKPGQVHPQVVIAVLMGIGAIVAIGLLSWSAWGG
jgi:hypothetical protein